MIAFWKRRGAVAPRSVEDAADAGGDDLFDPAFLAALDRFSLRVAEAQKGGRLADQRTPARGQGADFADFRSYTAGDDLRTIDWNLYRRLGKLFVRVFEERQDLPVYLLVDVSRSMFAENPPRIRAARRVAMGLAAVALRQHDAVSLLSVSDSVSTVLRGVGGKANAARIARALTALAPGGGTGLATALRDIAATRMRRGLVVVVSDFFDGAGVGETVAALRALRHRVLLVQMTRAYDAEPMLLPEMTGDVTLDDGEVADGLALTITPDLVEAYRRAWRGFNRHLADFAEERGAGLMRVDAGGDVLDQMTAFFAHGRMPA